MDVLQRDFERNVGDQFAEWLASSTNEPCTFLRRADEAPDLAFHYKGTELFIEITAAYYDREHARFLWKHAKDAPDAPVGWSGAEPDKSLAAAIASRISSKARKRYGPNTLLLVEVPPGVTSVERLSELLAKIALPSDVPFSGIYVVGRFPITSSSEGGYRVITVKAMSQ